jgi:hypothetical protein
MWGELKQVVNSFKALAKKGKILSSAEFLEVMKNKV